ncbi:MAG: NAD-dependent epimerase/dehydratase family protein [Candidatus Woesearchaeota archaeon]
MKRVVLTGGAGFIGSHVVEELKKKNYDVCVIDNLSKRESKLIKDIEFVKLDLTREKQTIRALKNCDYIIHLAAKIGGIGYFHKYPATIISENNKINSSVFNAAAKNNVKRIVYVSSSMVFESTKKFPSKEEDIYKIPPPKTAYGFSKLSGEYYCKAFKEEFNLNYTIIRPFNAYGINEYPGEEVGYAHVIPDLIKKILKNQYPLEILGDGKQIRCFTHVKDIARGIVLAMKHKKAENNDFNLSSDEPIRIIDLAKKLWSISNVKKQFKVKFVPGFKHDIKKRIPSIEKAKKVLGWEAKIRLDDGLKEVFEWLKEKHQRGEV